MGGKAKFYCPAHYAHAFQSSLRPQTVIDRQYTDLWRPRHSSGPARSKPHESGGIAAARDGERRMGMECQGLEELFRLGKAERANRLSSRHA